jgi:hypothetical protein
MLVSLLEINTSMILLPNTMRKESLMLVGYFSNKYDIFEEESQNQKPKSLQ